MTCQAPDLGLEGDQKKTFQIIIFFFLTVSDLEKYILFPSPVFFNLQGPVFLHIWEPRLIFFEQDLSYLPAPPHCASKQATKYYQTSD